MRLRGPVNLFLATDSIVVCGSKPVNASIVSSPAKGSQSSRLLAFTVPWSSAITTGPYKEPSRGTPERPSSPSLFDALYLFAFVFPQYRVGAVLRHSCSCLR